MNCEVCKKPLPLPDDVLRYCAYCGWPVGRLDAQITPRPLLIDGLLPTEVTLALRNLGPGLLRCRVATLPDGVTLAPGQSAENDLVSETLRLPLQVDPKRLSAKIEELTLTLRAEDGRGTHTNDFRPQNSEAAWREYPLALPVSRRRLGPVYVRQKMLLFREGRAQRLLILNGGDTPLTVNVRAEQGYTLRTPSDARKREALSLTLGPRPTTEAVLVDLPAGAAGIGRLFVEIPDLPECNAEVILCPIPSETPPRFDSRWIVAIDFGTAKSAVFVTDTFLKDPQPQGINWKNTGQGARVVVPSVVQYIQNRAMPRCGYDIAASNDPLTVYSIKKRLNDDTGFPLSNGKTTTDVVKDFLNFLISHVRQQMREQSGDDIFAEAHVVMCLPVLDQGTEFEEQKRRTLLAAEQAGLDGTKISFFAEPECAAIDFLRRRKQLKMTFQDGDLLCVFDCGAGTTDLCVMQVNYNGGGEPEFTPVALAGFPFGGDVVDELLTEYILKELDSRKMIESLSADQTKITFKGSRTPYSRSDMKMDVRRYKEKLPMPAANSAAPAVENHYKMEGLTISPPLVVDWTTVETLFSPYVESMLELGFNAGDTIPDWPKRVGKGRVIETDLPSARDTLYAKNIAPDRIKWLCLTGGSSLIPFMEAQVRGMFSGANGVVPTREMADEQRKQIDPEFILNVARGAAMRPLYRVEGRLPVSLSLRFQSTTRDGALTLALEAGCATGKKSRWIPFSLPMNEDWRLRVVAERSTERGAVSGEVYDLNRETPAPDREIALQARVEYEVDSKIYLTVQYSDESQWQPLFERAPIVE